MVTTVTSYTEVRNRALVGPLLGELLAEAGVAPCLTVHPTMPGVEEQSRELALDPSRPLVMRWMLRANHRYEEANRLSAAYCQRLIRHVAERRMDRLLSELRYSYRLGAEAKLRYLARAA